MIPMLRFLRRCFVLAAPLLGAACGAGLITGIASSSGGSRTGEVRPPQLSPVTPVMPLVPPPSSTRSVVVSNAPIAAAATIRVAIAANGVEVEQPEPVASGQGDSTVITFRLATGPIVASVADPSANDVAGELRVLVDGRPVATPVPILLARQPRAALVLGPGEAQRFVSPLGERVRVGLTGIATSDIGDLTMLVTTRDPSVAPTAAVPQPTVTRVCTNLQFEGAGGLDPVISGFVPGSAFPVAAEIVVVDAVAGVSTPITNAYYRPDIAVALPGQGPTTGGSVVTLIGTALVPFDFGVVPPTEAFEDVDVVFRKGGRIVALPREDLRVAESNRDRLVFTMPPSPDGRPGQVDIVLRVHLGDVTAEVTASQRFLFANPDPFFGPRGLVLDRLPVAVASIALDQAPNTDVAPDFAALTDQGGVAYLQLLLAQQSGMFQPFAAPRQIGNHEDPAEREPRDLCVGDFDGDGVPDVFITNAGAFTAVQHVVLGQAAPLPPLGAVHRVPTPCGMNRCRAARIDGDAVADVLLMPGAGAAVGQLPLLLLARPVAPGQPAFVAAPTIAFREFAYEAFEVADIDGDGFLDVAVVSGTEGKLDVAYGIGDGTFPTVVSTDFTVPNYTFDPRSPAVGLHACADGPLQSLGLVLAGVNVSSGLTLPTITVLRQTALRSFAAPALEETFRAPTEPIGSSLVADLDQSPPVEMVVAIRGEPPLISLGMLQLSATQGFQVISTGLEGGLYPSAEVPRNIRALAFDRSSPLGAGPEAKAVFIVHEAVVDGGIERRLSTRLVEPSAGAPPKLSPADSVDGVPFHIRAVVAGNFRGPQPVGVGKFSDLALARASAAGGDEGIRLILNTHRGGRPDLGIEVDFPGLLPQSLTLVPSGGGAADAVAFLGRDSRLGIWQPEVSAMLQLVSPPLRGLVTDPVLAATDLAESSRITRGDVDGDGIDDLVVLLSFDLPNPAEGQAAIALLRGKAIVQPGEFPFHLPSAVTPVHGRASAIELGDFARALPTQVRRLELAVAVPQGNVGIDGDHVRFFRYLAGATPADDRFVPSAMPGGPMVLLAGSRPTQLAAADFDGDGSTGLLVTCAGDNTLRLFRNTAPAVANAVDVRIDAFVQGLNSPWQLLAGAPTSLRLSDVNGDGSLDAVAFTEATVGSTVTSSVGIYLSSGTGNFDGPRRVSPTRIGSFNARLTGDLGDWNNDALPDLLLGWAILPEVGFNLRILFGGTR